MKKSSPKATNDKVKSRPTSKSVAKAKSPPAAKDTSTDSGKVKLLTGGNPQIAKADGDAPVQAFIAAMPGWKSDVGRWIDDVIVKTCPNIRKAVKWNSPFYGIEGQGWFAGFHCCTKYIKFAFFRGALLHPVPPGESKQEEVRYFHFYQDTPLDEAQFAAWVTQAAALPGWIP